MKGKLYVNTLPKSGSEEWGSSTPSASGAAQCGFGGKRYAFTVKKNKNPLFPGNWFSHVFFVAGEGVAV